MGRRPQINPSKSHGVGGQELAFGLQAISEGKKKPEEGEKLESHVASSGREEGGGLGNSYMQNR